MNWLFLSGEPSGDNFKAIAHLPAALAVGISTFRQRGAVVKGKVQDFLLWNE
jgi:hypothetical protein